MLWRCNREVLDGQQIQPDELNKESPADKSYLVFLLQFNLTVANRDTSA